MPEQSVQSWLKRIEDDPEGQYFVRNLREENCLHQSPQGIAALHALVSHVVANGPLLDGSNPVGALAAELKRSAATLLCQGSSVEDDQPTNDMCRVMTLETFQRHLLRPSALGKADTVGPDTWTRALQLMRKLQGNRRLVGQLLNQRAVVRGQLPVAFATPAEDRQKKWPTGTPVARVWEILGVRESAVPTCVLKFRRRSLDCTGHVPSALDAFTHPYFLPATPSDTWGWTRDLGSSDPSSSRGVRECVLRPFPTSRIDDIELIEA